MATTNIATEIQSLAKVTTANSTFLESAQKWVVSSIPKNYMWAFVSKTSDATANPISLPSTVVTDSIMGLVRNKYNCAEIEQKYRGMVEADDTNSLYFPTKRHPKYIKNVGGEYSIYPAPSGSEKAYVLYVDYLKIDDDSDLRNAIVFYCVSKEMSMKGQTKYIDWTEIALPQVVDAPDFGDDLQISVAPPVVPVIDKTILDTSEWVAPLYVSPSLQLADFPSLTWNFPTSPVAPSIASNSVADWDSATPTFTPPSFPTLDFTGMDSEITAEDPEMLQARNSKMQMQLSEYGQKMATQQAKFNEEQAIFQATVQTFTQEASMLEAHEQRKLSKFGSELQKYQADLNSIITENQALITAWSNEASTRVQNFQAQNSSALNDFNAKNVEFQSKVNKATQNAQYEEKEQQMNLQKYQAELGKYQQDVNREVTKFTQNLGKKVQEYSQKLSRFNAELTRQQAIVGQKREEANINLQQFDRYDKESQKYYTWATGEIQKFISNNERTTSRALTQQALNQK
tara:strand:+ start:6084 stop:7628 length:1545 start_codon:yes stop_codon:yes gene_type:complete